MPIWCISDSHVVIRIFDFQKLASLSSSSITVTTATTTITTTTTTATTVQCQITTTGLVINYCYRFYYYYIVLVLLLPFSARLGLQDTVEELGPSFPTKQQNSRIYIVFGETDLKLTEEVPVSFRFNYYYYYYKRI